MTEESQTRATNGDKLAKALQNLNWPTAALIALTGGGNWLATLQNRNQIDYSRERVFRQVEELHDSIEAFEKRQKQMLESLDASLKNQAQILINQNKMMESDSRMLEQIRQFQQNFKNPEF